MFYYSLADRERNVKHFFEAAKFFSRSARLPLLTNKDTVVKYIIIEYYILQACKPTGVTPTDCSACAGCYPVCTQVAAERHSPHAF
jgi:NAD-dependent dihydropyrimidine dehydrogenase PreA subunit